MRELVRRVAALLNPELCDQPYTQGDYPVIDWRCQRRIGHRGIHVRRGIPFIRPTREWV